jgi:hypothetical protein
MRVRLDRFNVNVIVLAIVTVAYVQAISRKPRLIREALQQG